MRIGNTDNLLSRISPYFGGNTSFQCSTLVVVDETIHTEGFSPEKVVPLESSKENGIILLLLLLMMKHFTTFTFENLKGNYFEEGEIDTVV